MKRIKMYAILALIVLMPTFWLIGGCTGGGIFDPNPTGTPTTSPTGTQTQIISFPTGKPAVDTLVSSASMTNVFNLILWGNSDFFNYVLAQPVTGVADAEAYVGEEVIWLENTDNGRVGLLSNNRTNPNPPVSTLVPGTNNPGGVSRPRAIAVRRVSGSVLDPNNYRDEIIIGTSAGTNSRIVRFPRTSNGVQAGQIVATVAGDINYFALDLGIDLFFTMDSGANSSILYTDILETNKVVTVDSTLTNAHDVYVYNVSVPPSATINPNSNKVLFVTDRNQNSGRVLMYDISEWDYASQVNNDNVDRFLIQSNGTLPSKVTFIPFPLQHAIPGGGSIWGTYQFVNGIIFWTENSPAGGTVLARQVTYNTNTNTYEFNPPLAAEPFLIAQGLNAPYDIIGPNDFKYTFVTGTVTNNVVSIERLAQEPPAAGISNWHDLRYNLWAGAYPTNQNPIFKIYVSLNVTQASNGNWAEIDVSDLNNPTVDATYLNGTAQYPANGEIELFAIVDPNAPGDNMRVFKKDLFFTSMDIENGGQGRIYHQPNTFAPIP